MHGILKFASAAALIVLAAAGCGGAEGPELALAGGIVTYQGRPIAGVRVTFIPEGKGSIAIGTTDQEGKFQLKTGLESGVAVGRCNATVTLMEGSGSDELPEDMSPEDMQMMMMSGELESKLESKSLIPKKYARPETSGLSFEVKSGEDNQFEIQLTD